MKTLIKNGAIVTASDTIQADILVDGETVALLGQNLPGEDAVAVDASGKFILPGAIDVHTHLDLPMMGTCSSDDFYTGHKAAAFGGTTSHIDFAIQSKGETLYQALETWHAKARDKAVIDYGFHMTLTDPTEAALNEIPSMVNYGVTTIKILMAYKGRLQVDDTGLFRALLKTAEAGMLMMVHAENGDAIEVLIQDALARGNLAPVHHALTRPHWCEAEATLRAIALAAVAQAPLYVVHMTCQAAVEQLTYGRERGLKVMGETCPQYLFFTTDNLRQEDGAKWVFSPPVRTRADNEYLWQALGRRELQVVGTDHCPFPFDGTRPILYEGQPFTRAGKELGRDDFTRIPNGAPGIQDRMPVLWAHGVGAGRLTLNQLAELTSANPAKVFGLYPRKGTIAVGSDADLVIWDPNLKKTMGVATSHQRTDYNLYEGMEVTGWPEKVYSRGRLLVDGDEWHGKPGTGAYLARKAHATVV
jgi:dihydropyrimidinase